MSPGFKFNDWEMRGVPLRMELGPKDVAKGVGGAGAARPPGQEGKSFAPQEDIAGDGCELARGNSAGAARQRAGVSRREHPGARRSTTNSRRRSRPALRSPVGAAAKIAKQRSRKRPRRRCGAFRSNRKACSVREPRPETASASIAVRPPASARFSAGHTECPHPFFAGETMRRVRFAGSAERKGLGGFGTLAFENRFHISRNAKPTLDKIPLNLWLRC